MPRQTLDDVDARHQSLQAQLELAKAQFMQAQARLDELKIKLSSTEIRSPVNGFVGKRMLDPGAYVSSNTTVVSMVQIDRVRLVANVVEKDLRRVLVGSAAASKSTRSRARSSTAAWPASRRCSIRRRGPRRWRSRSRTATSASSPACTRGCG